MELKCHLLLYTYSWLFHSACVCLRHGVIPSHLVKPLWIVELDFWTLSALRDNPEVVSEC